MSSNILFILTDQWPHNFFGRMGMPAPTPHTDRLGAEGTVFTNAFTTCPLCSPARGTLLTARWPCQTGMIDNPAGYSQLMELDPQERTWIDAAVDAGYHVGYYGKWHLGEDGPIRRGAHRHSPGFDRGSVSYDPAVSSFSYTRTAARYKKEADRLCRYGVPAFYGRAKCPEEETVAFRLAEDACAFLEEYSTMTTEKPFFLTVSFPDPHFPHYLPDRFADLAESLDIDLPVSLRDAFDCKPAHHSEPWWPCMDTSPFDEDEWKRVIAYSMAHITMTDEAIGRVLDSLAEMGLADSTTIVFTADHGDMCGAHNRFDKGAYFYEEVWRIPLTIRRPHQTPATQNTFVSLIDIGRTLFQMTGSGAASGRPLAGRDLRPLLDHGSGTDFPHRAFGMYDMYNGMRFAVRAIRDGQFKYVWNPQAVDEFYDLVEDPHELTNRATDPACREQLQRLRTELLEWMQTVGDRLPDRAASLPDAGTIVATGRPGP